MIKNSPLRICLDARLVDGSGGVQQVVLGLASGLSKLTDGDEQYFFLSYNNHCEWLRPYLQGACQLLLVPDYYESEQAKRKRFLASVSPVLQKIWHRLKYLIGPRVIHVPHSDGTIEKADIEVMHFTKQVAFLTNIPSIYEPYDLQHLHLPQFFTPLQSLDREVQYRTFCQQAHLVSAMTTWVKQDLIKQYALLPEKIVVVPRPPVLTAYSAHEDLLVTRQKFTLPDTFIFYPAQTWPHKNHLGLLESLAILRDQFGSTVVLVCSGKQNDFFPKIKQCIHKLQLTQQVQFLGFVNPLELQALYQLSRAMIFPSKFEGWGLPLVEAFLVGTPVACSNVTSLPDLVGDSALLFNPDQPLEIAAAIHRLWVDPFLREQLIERGRKNVTRFSWEKTARTFRAYYRQIANRSLTDEDRVLLQTSSC